jgi:hypothetical protein
MYGSQDKDTVIQRDVTFITPHSQS